MWHFLLLIVVFFVLSLKLYLKLTCGICKCSAHLFGKTAIVTGANTGIGYETALDFASRGARVIMACRSRSRGIVARDKIINATNNDQVVYKYLDLSSLASVRSFVADIAKEEKHLHILVNNAGAGGIGDKKSEDGLQIGLQVNYFGPYLLTRLLEPLLRSSAPSRIINVSSSFHRLGKLDFSNLNMERGWSDFDVYTNSKLYNVLMTLEHSKRLSGTGVVTNCLHPGVVATEVWRNIPVNFIRRTIDFIVRVLFKSPWEGAQTTIYLSVAPEMSQVSGKYFVDCRESKPSALARDVQAARRLWEETEELVKI